jgi:hypothetical protein
MWSVIRIVLTVLNVLGAIAICALVALDYGQVRTWTYSVLLHDVALHGLPIDEDAVVLDDVPVAGLPIDADDPTADSRKIAKVLGEQGKKDVFGGQPSPVATQLEEVNRFKKRFDDAIAASTDKRIQLVNLARILTPLATSEPQRERLMAMQTYLADAKTADQLKQQIADAAQQAVAAAKDEKRKPAKDFTAAFAEEVQRLPGPSRKPFAEAFLLERSKLPVAEQNKPVPHEIDVKLFEDAIDHMRESLQVSYNDAFTPALTGKPPADGFTKAERKAYIAWLLFNLVEPLLEIDTQKAYAPGTQWDLATGPYLRYLTVVGLEAGVQAIRQKAQVQAQMADDLRLEMDSDRSNFVTEHQRLYNQLQQAAAKESQLGEVLSRQKDLLAKRQALVNDRKRDVKLFEAELAKLGKETGERLAEVRSMDDELYRIRVDTRNATEDNQKYEQKIRSLEEGH